MKKVDLANTNDDQDANDLDLDDEDNDEEDDEDLDLDDDDSEDDDDQPSPKGRKSRSSAGPSMADISAELRNLQQLVKSGSPKDKTRVTKLEETISQLATQYKPESLVPLLQMVQAMRDDLTEDYSQAQVAENQRKVASDVEDHINTRLDSLVNKYVKQVPSIRWAKKEMGEKVINLLNRSKNFESVRLAYGAGRMPARASLNEAVDKIAKAFLTENGIVKGGNSNSIDSRPSKTKLKSAATAKGDFDPSKLDDFERSIYRDTLNITKNPELAKEAVRNLGGLR